MNDTDGDYTSAPADESQIQEALQKLRKDLELYDARFVECLDLPGQWPRPLSERALISTVRLLQRARLLMRGVVGAVKRQNIIVALLCVRAHYETTAFLVYCLRRLERMYDGELTEEEAQKAIDKVGLGSRRDPHGLGIAPPHVLTAIDEVDKFIRQRVGYKDSEFRAIYDFLSEFCHPNAYGMSVIARPRDDLQHLDLQREPSVTKHQLDLTVNHVLMSSYTFRIAFDAMWALLRSQNPDLPCPG